MIRTSPPGRALLLVLVACGGSHPPPAPPPAPAQVAIDAAVDAAPAARPVDAARPDAPVPPPPATAAAEAPPSSCAARNVTCRVRAKSYPAGDLARINGHIRQVASADAFVPQQGNGELEARTCRVFAVPVSDGSPSHSPLAQEDYVIAVVPGKYRLVFDQCLGCALDTPPVVTVKSSTSARVDVDCERPADGPRKRLPYADPCGPRCGPKPR